MGKLFACGESCVIGLFFCLLSLSLTRKLSVRSGLMMLAGHRPSTSERLWVTLLIVKCYVSGITNGYINKYMPLSLETSFAHIGLCYNA